MADSPRKEMGDFLRSRRVRTSPEHAATSDGRRRRTPGLRREEVAELAGIGVDWYVRLEQGRPVHPSPQTVAALARVLHLNAAEGAHLRALAERAGHAAFARERVPPALRRIVEALPHPAYLTGRRWDLLAWNAAAETLFGFGRLAAEDCNVLLYVLTDSEARSLFGRQWSEEARRMVAQFRATYDFWAGDIEFERLVSRLRAGCIEFDGWWEAHDVRATGTGHKTLHSAAGTARRFEYATFQANDDPALKLALYTRR